MEQFSRAALIGEPIRNFKLPATNGQEILITELTGRYTLLVFYGVETAEICIRTLRELGAAIGQFNSAGVQILGISPSPIDRLKNFAQATNLPFTLMSDADMRVSLHVGALRPTSSEPLSSPEQTLKLTAFRRSLLLGPDGRILEVYDNPDPATHAAKVLKDVEQHRQRDLPRRMVAHAPVLIIPDVFPKSLCEKLIRVWDERGHGDSGFMKQIDGKTVGVFDYSHKIRQDHFLSASPEYSEVQKYLGTRLVPYIRQAFNYDPTRSEDFRIACYDAARGGYFRPHRDNTTEGTAHRRFAVSLLLNDEYEGGYLRFPEFGLHEYRPKAGGAVVFSCSLLHEATDITAGQRFVLLTFLYGEKEAKARQEYNLRTGGAYRA